MTLYEIESALLECIDEENGDIIDIDRLEALELERDTKISNIACWIKDLKAEAAAIKEEKMKLAKRQQAAETKAEQLSNYLDGYLNGATFKDSRCSIGYRKSTSVKLDENIILEKLPVDCINVKVTPALSAIKEALSKGIEIDGAHLVTTNNIQIK